MRWQRSWKADPRLAALADRHYSRGTVGAAQVAPPGRLLCLITPDGRAGWVSWITDHADAEWLKGAWCGQFFRNEAPDLYLSSELIREALAATAAAWGSPPPAGTVTLVDPRHVRSKRAPGRCFRHAGFVALPERTKDRGLVILHLAPADHPAPAEALNTQQVLAA
jgi:hypothetical protein